MFSTNFSLSNFYEYYLDLTKRIKANDVDITIVVNMLLTGFDSPLTDVLWVDKNLEMHSLIQAFSRTNRILNSVKSYGKIVCFRDLRKEVDEALALYGDKEANGLVILHSYLDYLNGFTDNHGKRVEGYKDIVSNLTSEFSLPMDGILGESKEKRFIKLFSSLLRMRNIITSFDEFEEVDKELLAERSLQNYQSKYLDLKDKYDTISKNDKESVLNDIEFETELVHHSEINIDYILKLIEKYHDSNCRDGEIIVQIQSAISSNVSLRSKKELIEGFYQSLNIGEKDIPEKWVRYVEDSRERELDALIDNEPLLRDKDRVKEFVYNSFKNGYIKTYGSQFSDLLSGISLFDKKRNEKIDRVRLSLEKYFEKYKNLLKE